MVCIKFCIHKKLIYFLLIRIYMYYSLLSLHTNIINMHITKLPEVTKFNGINILNYKTSQQTTEKSK